MPGQATRRDSGPRNSERAGGDVGLLGLLRQTHIFASTVREILEVKLLREVSDAHLTLPQLQLLKLMVRDGQHQVTEVAHFLGVSPPAATKNIDKLEGLPGFLTSNGFEASGLDGTLLRRRVRTH